MTDVDELEREARLWDGARIAHLDQARSSLLRTVELERQRDEALAEADRLLRSARRDLEHVRQGLQDGRHEPRPPRPA